LKSRHFVAARPRAWNAPRASPAAPPAGGIGPGGRRQLAPAPSLAGAGNALTREREGPARRLTRKRAGPRSAPPPGRQNTWASFRTRTARRTNEGGARGIMKPRTPRRHRSVPTAPLDVAEPPGGRTFCLRSTVRLGPPQRGKDEARRGLEDGSGDHDRLVLRRSPLRPQMPDPMSPSTAESAGREGSHERRPRRVPREGVGIPRAAFVFVSSRLCRWICPPLCLFPLRADLRRSYVACCQNCFFASSASIASRCSRASSTARCSSPTCHQESEVSRGSPR
jgi:hypothetical protein